MRRTGRKERVEVVEEFNAPVKRRLAPQIKWRPTAKFYLERGVETSEASYIGSTDDEESEYSKPIAGSERSIEVRSSKSSAIERVESRTLEIDFDKDIIELAKNGTFRVMRSSNFDWDPFNVWIGFRGDVLVATIEVLQTT